TRRRRQAEQARTKQMPTSRVSDSQSSSLSWQLSTLWRTALPLRVRTATNATRDRPNCQLMPRAGANGRMTVPGDETRSVRSLAIILIVHLAVIVLWQVLVDVFHVPKFILPSPLAALATLGSAKYAWLSNL